jgi:hypothetical protein
MSLEFLIEDCVDSSFNDRLPAKRRNDILTELKSKDLAMILSAAYGMLSQCFGHLRSGTATVSTAPVDPGEVTAAMNAVLSMLGPVALLAKANEMTDPAHNFADVAVLLLAVEPLSARALELLARVVRPGQALSRESMASLLRALPPVLQAVLTPSGGGSSSSSRPQAGAVIDGHIYYGNPSSKIDSDGIDKLEHVKKLVETATVLLAGNIDLLADRQDSDAMDKEMEGVTELYVETVLSATVFTSSRRLYLDAVKLWMKLMKTPLLKKLPFMQSIVMKLLIMYVGSASKVPWHTDEDAPAAFPYSEDEVLLTEFESAEEFIGSYGVLRAVVSDLVKEAARGFPVVAARFISNYLSFVVDKLGAEMTSSVNSEAYVETENCVLFLESVCNSISMGVADSAGVVLVSPEVETMGGCAQRVLAWQPLAPLLVVNKMR